MVSVCLSYIKNLIKLSAGLAAVDVNGVGMHKLLKEQVEQYLAETGVEGGIDPRFLDIVSASYHEAEENSLDLEMSLSLIHI